MAVGKLVDVGIYPESKSERAVAQFRHCKGSLNVALAGTALSLVPAYDLLAHKKNERGSAWGIRARILGLLRLPNTALSFNLRSMNLLQLG